MIELILFGIFLAQLAYTFDSMRIHRFMERRDNRAAERLEVQFARQAERDKRFDWDRAIAAIQDCANRTKEAAIVAPDFSAAVEIQSRTATVRKAVCDLAIAVEHVLGERARKELEAKI